MSKIRIRESSDLDELEEINNLNNALFPGAALGPLLDSSTWWLAEYDAEGVWTACGYAGAELTNEGQYCFLSRAGVLRMARGRGLQKRLIYVREAWARKHGATHAWTYVFWSNLASMRNLVSWGYVPYTVDIENDSRFVFLKKKL